MQEKPELVIAIPARRGSTRLPEKLLLSKTGKPLLSHTVARAVSALLERGYDREQACRRVWVVCDDPQLQQIALQSGVSAILTGPCDSGTERIAVALGSLPECEVVVNLQADEPEIPADWILDCADAFAASRPAPDVTTVAVPIAPDDPGLADPSLVKVVLDHSGKALYFSRATIPAVRVGGKPPVPRALGHLGIYAFSVDFLRRYPRLPASPLEASECLEQLRFLQAGAHIHVVVKPERHAGGIDTEEDYAAFVERQRGA